MALIAACFVVLIAQADPVWGEVIAGFAPSREIFNNPTMLYLALGIIGATVMPHNLYLHSGIVQTRAFGLDLPSKREALRLATWDSTIALMFALTINASILILAAAAFYTVGQNDVAEIDKAHLLLEPLLGSSLAPVLFGVALLCAGLKAGEIVLFDKGYHQLAHFWELTQRSVFFVTRPKEGLLVRVVRRRSRQGVNERVLADEEIMLVGKHSRAGYPQRLRRVRARVVVDGQEREMVFVTNNFDWSPWSVAELYRCRWQIEAFFKQIKQTLQLADFLGHSANAVQWQVWMALLVYVLLRFQAWCSRWAHSFSRLLTVLRAALWQRRDLAQLLRRYGTAEGSLACLAGSLQSWLPGLTP